MRGARYTFLNFSRFVEVDFCFFHIDFPSTTRATVGTPNGIRLRSGCGGVRWVSGFLGGTSTICPVAAS